MTHTYDQATLENGDRCTGRIVLEDGKKYFVCVDRDGNEYETTEQPYIRIDLVYGANKNQWPRCPKCGGIALPGYHDPEICSERFRP